VRSAGGVLRGRRSGLDLLQRTAAGLDAEVARAAGQGGELLVLPEYAPLELAGGAVPDLDVPLQVIERRGSDGAGALLLGA
jgi:hypothetical protein